MVLRLWLVPSSRKLIKLTPNLGQRTKHLCIQYLYFMKDINIIQDFAKMIQHALHDCLVKHILLVQENSHDTWHRIHRLQDSIKALSEYKNAYSISTQPGSMFQGKYMAKLHNAWFPPCFLRRECLRWEPTNQVCAHVLPCLFSSNYT